MESYVIADQIPTLIMTDDPLTEIHWPVYNFPRNQHGWVCLSDVACGLCSALHSGTFIYDQAEL